MRFVRISIGLLAVSLFSGCASLTTQELRNECFFGAMVVSATAGGVISPLGAGAGALVGAATGAFVCGDTAEPATARVTPKPTKAKPTKAKLTKAEPTGYFWPDDEDGDGVLDSSDHCRFTPSGVAVDGKGCARDSDGDGVPNYRDQCPKTPLGRVVDLNGCEYGAVASKKPVSSRSVLFEFDSASLGSDAKSALDRLLPTIQSHSAWNVNVKGHTDSTGPDAYNQDLSKRRAVAVVNYLVSKGVDRSRLKAIGVGESMPVSTNDTHSGRAENRRADIFFGK